MAIELLAGLTLSLAVQARAAILARAAGPQHLGDGGREASADPAVKDLPLVGPDFELAFELRRPVKGVHVQISKVEGLQRSDEAAPGVFIDGFYLGPMRREHNGGAWNSPFTLDLGAGRHRVRLQSWPKDADDFVWRGLTVYTGALAVGPKIAPDTAPQQTSVPVPENDCAEGASLPWPASLKGRSLTLSVLSGREASSPLLAMLKPRSRFLARFKVPRSPDPAGQPPLLLHAREEPGLLTLGFEVDTAAKGKPNAPLGYQPGQWNALQLDWCAEDGALRLQVGDSNMQLKLKPGPKELRVKVKDIEMALDQERPGPTED